jgi:hypothetical protein
MKKFTLALIPLMALVAAQADARPCRAVIAQSLNAENAKYKDIAETLIDAGFEVVQDASYADYTVVSRMIKVKEHETRSNGSSRWTEYNAAVTDMHPGGLSSDQYTNLAVARNLPEIIKRGLQRQGIRSDQRALKLSLKEFGEQLAGMVCAD